MGIKILHIAPHLGGGVGSVLRGFFSCKEAFEGFSHSVATLEDINDISRKKLKETGITYVENCHRNYGELQKKIIQSDVVLVHWWNHPLLQNLIFNFDIPKCRLLFWSHISCREAPNVVCDYVMQLPDEFVFTTPLSRFSPSVAAYLRSSTRQFEYIWSTSASSTEKEVNTINLRTDLRKNKLHLGYVGNLDETKISRDFFNIVAKLDPSKFHISVIGPRTAFFDKMSELNKMQNLEVLGFVSEEVKREMYRSFDVIIYPLTKDHYGTCDQVIQEAMCFGLPVVAFNNPMESYMIRHGETGFLANNVNEFVDFVNNIASEPNALSLMRVNCLNYAKRFFLAEKMVREWNRKLSLTMSREKRKRSGFFSSIGRKLTPSELMAESLGIHGELFKAYLQEIPNREYLAAQIRTLKNSPSWRSPTKSTAMHYQKYFKDPILNEWCALLEC
jgi:glycosyltransferase involved in cell wall biosynthesis